MEWYYILGIISYGIFIVQFLLSNFGGDIELDVDFDGNTDFDVSSLLSFKGLIHFAMGFSSWLMITGEVTIISLIIAACLGIIFMIILFYLYKLCLKLHSEPTNKEGIELVGRTVTVIYVFSEDNCICTVNNLPYKEIKCSSSTPVKAGDIKIISSYENGTYYLN